MSDEIQTAEVVEVTPVESDDVVSEEEVPAVDEAVSE